MSWPEAINNVGIALAVAATIVGFMWGNQSMTDHPVKVGTKVRCKNKNWPDEPGVVERIEGDQRFAAVRFGDRAHTLSTYLEDLEPVA